MRARRIPAVHRDSAGQFPKLGTRSVRHHQQVEAVRHLSIRTLQPPAPILANRSCDFRSPTDFHALVGHRPQEVMQQHLPVQSSAEQIRADLPVIEQHETPFVSLHDAEPFHPGGPLQDGRENAEPIEHRHTRGLQEKACSHGPAFRRALEDDHFVPEPTQKNRRRGPGGSASNDSDTHGFRSVRSGTHRRSSRAGSEIPQDLCRQWPQRVQ